MAGILAIDLGTSAVKAVVIDEIGTLRAVAAREYPIESPRSGWAEQNPAVWWEAAARAVKQAIQQVNLPIQAIGLSGQMHGLVLVSAVGKSVRPAIIWADQRSTAEVAIINDRLGTAGLVRIAGTAPRRGLASPTLNHRSCRLDSTTRRARLAIRRRLGRCSRDQQAGQQGSDN